MLELEFDIAGEVFEWRGPAPYYYLAVPAEASQEIQDAASLLSYGWGVIPVRVTLGQTTWTTSLFPKDGRYLVPLKDAVRRAEGVEPGARVALRLVAGPRD